MGDFGIGRRKGGIDWFHLAGMDGHLALETELSGRPCTADETPFVAQVDPDGVEGRFEPGSARGDDQGRTGMLAFDFAP